MKHFSIAAFIIKNFDLVLNITSFTENLGDYCFFVLDMQLLLALRFQFLD